MTELKPCPFCGGEDLEIEHYETWGDDIHPEVYWIHCPDCGGDGGEKWTEAEAIAAWNTRAVETCKNIGYYIDGTRFKCSNCGYNGWTKWAKDGYDRVPNYCPNCGAKVVD